MTALRHLVPATVLALLVLLASTSASALPVAAQGEAGSAPPMLDYELVDEWGEQPWRRQPGFFTSIDDVTSTPDGTRYVLSIASRRIHRLAPDGKTWDLLIVPYRANAGAVGQRDFTPSRIDAGPDGTVAVMGRLSYVIGDDIVDPTYVVLELYDQDKWRLTHRVSLDSVWSYADFALGPGGRAYFARWTPNDTRPQTSVDVVAPLAEDPAGTKVVIAPPELGHPYRVDVQADGTIYTVAERCNCSPRPPPPPRTPSPTRTPRPSLLGAAGEARGLVNGVGQIEMKSQGRLGAGAEPQDALLAGDGDGINGVVVIGPDGRTRDTWSVSYVMDIAVSDAGAYVSQAGSVWDVRLRYKIFDATDRYAAGVKLVAIDLSDDGRVAVANETSGYVGLFEPSLDGSNRVLYFGLIDQVPLAGPYWPRRLSVADDSDEVVVLDRQVRLGTGHHSKSGSHFNGSLLGSLHRWQTDGTLWAQNGILGRDTGWSEEPVDVSTLDSQVFSITNRRLFVRADPTLPIHIRSFPGRDSSGRDALLAAVDAHDGHVAVLDVGRERVLWLTSGGTLQREWSTWSARPNALPADVAVYGERVYLADRGRNRIMVRDAHGGDLGEWPTHDGPLRIAAGPHGDVFVLGRGGWLLRYTAEGELVSWWRLPHRDVGGLKRAITPGDLDIDDVGRVYVSWWVEGPKDTVLAGQAGISVYESVLRPAPEGRRPLQPGACLVEPDKRAAPGRVALGATVDVTLTLRGECPGTHRPSQVMVVFDRSASIEWNGALLRAQDAMVGLLDTLNGEAVEIGLVSFADGGALEVPLTDRLGEVRGRIASLSAGGDTRMAAGIDLARRELLGPRRDPDAEPHIWIVSDGVFKDQPTEAVEAAKADGIILDALIFRTHEFDNDVRDALRLLVGGQHLHEELRPEREIGIVQQITAFDPQRGLFDNVTIDDVIPDNMRLVEGSIQPPAARIDASTLRWTHLDVLAAEPITMTFKLEPLELGLHPTNVEADARWLDAWGHPGRLPFPVPMVEVVAPPTATPTPVATATPVPEPVIYLPFTSRYRCHRRQPLDIVLTVDTSGSMGRPVVGQPGTALDVARQGMRDFVKLLDLPRDRVAVVEFNAAARVVTELTGDRAQVMAGIDGLRHASGSRLDQGLALAAHALDNSPTPRGRPVVILLSDGEQYDSRKLAFAWGDAMRGRGITVYAVGFGPTVDEELLRRLVSTPDRYYRSIGAQDLLPVYGRIGSELACPGG